MVKMMKKQMTAMTTTTTKTRQQVFCMTNVHDDECKCELSYYNDDEEPQEECYIQSHLRNEPSL